MATVDQCYINDLQQGAYKPGQVIPLGGVWNQYTDVAQSRVQPLYWYHGNLLQQAALKVFKFFRINKEAEVIEGAEVTDPVDRLRIKVARWLNNA